MKAEGRIQKAPWDACPRGVVSLYDMLDFAADEFVQLSHQLGLLLGDVQRPFSTNPDSFSNMFGDICVRCFNLRGYLPVTESHLSALLVELHVNAPEDIKQRNRENASKGVYMFSGRLTHERMTYYAEMISSSLEIELRSLLIKAIPRDRNKYWGDWLQPSEIPQKFPASLDELQRAGVCYSTGEATACVFHSMRALEPGLATIASYFRVPFAHENWQNVIERVELAVRTLGKQPKSPEKAADETFFGAAASHFYFIKNAWRNHVAHGRANYSDAQALRIMEHTKDFLESLCPRLAQPDDCKESCGGEKP